jgi:3-phenylpropionate/trans-cinnamate dioxygenase ferredoxin subunit
LARHRVAAVTEVPIDAVKKVEVDGAVICLAHAEDGNFYALDDVCSHEDFSLSQGELWELTIECPQHGSRFDLRTGRPSALPAVEPVATYTVSVEGDDVYVDL